MSEGYTTTIRNALRWLPLLALVFVTGCSGCEPRSCPETPCGPGAYCAEGVCYLESEGCDGCAGDEHCFRGECVPDGTQCAAAETYCDPTLAVAEGFHCVDWDGSSGEAPLCSSYCSDNGTCDASQVCFGLNAGSGTACDAPTACPTGELCVQGQCRTTACRPSECEGVLVGDATCQDKYAGNPQYPNGAKCQTLESGANYCFPAGQSQLGAECIDADTASQNNSFQQTCALGLACVDGRCETPCAAGDDCAEGESCIGLEDARVAEGAGYCAEACEPFTSGQCDGGTCLPINADEGTCAPAGDRRVGDRCAPGAAECAPGTICTEYSSGSTAAGVEQEARCQPMCDLTVADANADGTIDGEAQDARDDTCPQPEAAPASLRIVHLSETLGPVDVYRRGVDQPIAEGLAFEASFPASGQDAWHELEPGQYDFDVLEAGAPRSDFPLVTISAALGEGQGRTLAIGPPAPTGSDDATATAFDYAAPEPGATRARVVHLVSDADEVDVVAVEQGADLANPDNQFVLAEDLVFGGAGGFAQVPDATFDMYVFPTGADRSDAANAVVALIGLDLETDSTIYVRGTLDETDFFDVGAPTVLDAPQPPQALGEGASFTCVALGDRAYGYCQQTCPRGPADFGQEGCQGDAMGCAPREFPDRGAWETVCRPVGEVGPQQPCDPSISAGQCQEGLYCLEYGSTAEHVATSGLRGLCTSLCATNPSAETTLSCASGQSCQPISFAEGYEVGRCGYECTPDRAYSDPACPEGLKSCLPVSSLGQAQTAPEVTREQSFCSQSGDISPGEQCFGADCEAGSECMYDRSVETDLVSTLVSQYFADGSTPTCQPQCDPFDGDSSQFECGPSETCLFNFPWSAEVGHCATIAEDLGPGDACENPGLSCGEDSICVLDGEVPTCFRFCDYEGTNAQGALAQSTCPSGYECTPFVSDIGICSRPQ
ncbi:MAG: DUF4397 domain-containing protein [Myxococcota bacterium]